MVVASPWRLIRSGPLAGAFNMALDQVLLDAVATGRSQPVLRLYRWAPATVTVGYGQRRPGAVDHDACLRLGIDVVRRPTGGRTVLHDREMTYAVIAPQRSRPFPGALLDNYRVIAGVLRQTLAAFGVAAELAAGRRGGSVGEGVRKHACFSAPALAELVCGRYKVAGCAQKRQGGAFLQHGSVPVEMDLDLLCRLLGGAPERLPAQRRQLADSVGWLNRFSPVPVPLDQLEAAFVETFSRQPGVELQPGLPTAEERARAEDLAASRFADPCWRRGDLPVDSPARRDYV